MGWGKLENSEEQTLEISALRMIETNGMVDGVSCFGEDLDFAPRIFGGTEHDFLKEFRVYE